MSNLLYVTFRDKGVDVVPNGLKKIETIKEKYFHREKITQIDNKSFVLTSYKPLEKNDHFALLNGHLFEDDNYPWWEVGNSYPDGNYIIIRENQCNIELLSDAFSSQTLWYYSNDSFFIASTSQLSIICYLENFQFNKSTISWMLATGTLGPSDSWDNRVKRLPPNSKISIDKGKWLLDIGTEKFSFVPEYNKKKSVFKKELSQAISQVFNYIEPLYSKSWYISLSGGYDSRAVLLCSNTVKNNDAIKTITWGKHNSLLQKGTDPYIAQKLSHNLGVENSFFEINSNSLDIETIFDRFIHESEGQHDNIAGYLDGFETWFKIQSMGVRGLVRGDEAFGWLPVKNDKNVLESVGLNFITEYQYLSKFFKETNGLPDDFKRMIGETNEQWRDRLYQQFRLPTLLSALGFTKSNFVEQINPLLSKKIMAIVRTMPDSYRTNKKVFSELIDSLSPNIPYANKGGNLTLSEFLLERRVKSYITSELEKGNANKILGCSFINDAIKKYHAKDINRNISILVLVKNNLRKVASSFLPRKVKNILSKGTKKSIPIEVIILRCFLIVKMNNKLSKLVDEK